MKSSIRLVSCLALFAVAALSLVYTRPASASGGQAEDEAKQLIKLDEQWCAAAAARDVDKLASFYAEDGVAYPPDEPVAKGRAAAKKIWAAYLADPSFKITWKPDTAEVSGDLGFTAGPYEVSLKGPDGSIINAKGKFLCVWKKQKDGSWKAFQDMWNADSK